MKSSDSTTDVATMQHSDKVKLSKPQISVLYLLDLGWKLESHLEYQHANWINLHGVMTFNVNSDKRTLTKLKSLGFIEYKKDGFMVSWLITTSGRAALEGYRD